MSHHKYALVHSYLGIVGALNESNAETCRATWLPGNPRPPLTEAEYDLLWPEVQTHMAVKKNERGVNVRREREIRKKIDKGETVPTADFQWYVVRMNDPLARRERAIYQHEEVANG